MWRAWRFSASAPTQPVGPDDDLATAPNQLLWIDASDIDRQQLTALGERFGIHELAVEDLGEGGQRTKLEDYGDHWHVALYDCRIDGAEFTSNEIDVVFGDRWIVTRHHGLDTAIIDEARRRHEILLHTDEIATATRALWAVLDVIVDGWFDVSEAIDEVLERIEDTVFDGRNSILPSDVFALRRSLVAFRRTAAPTREVLAELIRGEIDGIGTDTARRLHDVNDHVLRILEILEAQRELLTALFEAQLAIASNRMNQVMKATSSWGAILVLNTLIAGIYGMNFRHMPELNWVVGYPLALASMLAVTVGGYVLFKRRGWL